LAPVELPETQLCELYDYAMSFVQSNNHDLMETLFAINLTLFREYRFAPVSTRLETTPYEVFTSKKGVCQDFANLFICMARLLGISPTANLFICMAHRQLAHGGDPLLLCPGNDDH